MKKFLSLLLAAMMLLSCASAMAASDLIQNTTHADWDTVDGDVEAYDSVQYADAADYDTTGELGTELWLQVTADGQIDVTVPLVLVFQTNIDGGKANTAAKYEILNNNNAEVVVTKVEFEKTTTNNENPMTMVAYSTADSALQENQFKAQMNLVDGNLLLNKTIENGKETAKPNLKNSNTKNTGLYDMNTVSYEKIAKEGGLFKLSKVNNGTTPTGTKLNVAMSTGRLTFVTATNNATPEVLDTSKGVQLMTITYTVAIDTHNQYGETINGANGSTLTSAGSVVEVDGNGSGTIPADSNNSSVVPQNITSTTDGE